ncbi:MAG: DUF924 domain-containing protein [Rhodospirillaceae bacterium]|nr:DUF924 domain-containing protein [Rhodospirillaceae bacterium]
MPSDAESVLAFWFDETETKQWFIKDADFDATIEKRFGGLHAEAARGELDSWCDSAKGSLALVILLDQFSRNIFRGDPRTFSTDAKALDISKMAIANGYDGEVEENARGFFYLPFEHSENIADQERAIELFSKMGNKNLLEWAEKHKVIIERFGRFPHRNEVLGRESTPEELQFLTEDGSSF